MANLRFLPTWHNTNLTLMHQTQHRIFQKTREIAKNQFPRLCRNPLWLNIAIYQPNTAFKINSHGFLY